MIFQAQYHKIVLKMEAYELSINFYMTLIFMFINITMNVQLRTHCEHITV